MEEVKTLLSGAISIRTCHPGLCGRSLLFGNLLGTLLIYVGVPFHNQPLGKSVELLKIIGGIVYIAILKAKPMDILFDRVYILHILLNGICIIEAQIAYPSVTLSNTKIYANSFCMPNVQIAVGFGWEARLHATLVKPFGKVLLHNLLHKIKGAFFFFRLFNGKSRGIFVHLSIPATIGYNTTKIVNRTFGATSSSPHSALSLERKGRRPHPTLLR